MGNAPEEIRQMFEYGTADNDHDGIAEVLEQLFGADTEVRKNGTGE